MGSRKAADHFPVTRELYAENVINVSIIGDLEQTEVLFGLKKSRDSKAPEFFDLEAKLLHDARKDMIGPLPDTEDSLEIIAYFLDLYQPRNGMVSVSQLDGFLLACAASPQPVLPSRYIPHIWDRDGDPDAGPVWDSMDEAELFNQSLLVLHNKEAQDLQDRTFSPVVMLDSPDEDSRESFHDWSLGAAIGVMLWDLESKRVQELARELVDELLNIVALELQSEDPDENVGQPGAERAFAILLEVCDQHRQAPGQAGPTRDFSDHQPYERDAPKIGRNDPCPCPCGSGKKHKKCCMN